MGNQNTEYPLVSVLFITYKRFEYLERTFEAFRRHTDYPNLELVIADDGSGPEIQEKLRGLKADRYAMGDKNLGLGANNNAGLRLCTGKYVLMIQEDCVCYGPPQYLRDAVGVLEANPDVGMINLSGGWHPPDYSRQLAGSDEPCYLTPAPRVDGVKEHFLYSDQPHLRTMESVRLLGPYNEDRDMERCERNYEERWRDQTRFRTAVFPRYYRTVFRHDNSAPSYRTGKFRYRAAAAFVPTAGWLKRNFRPLYRLSRACFLAAVRGLERLRIVR